MDRPTQRRGKTNSKKRLPTRRLVFEGKLGYEVAFNYKGQELQGVIISVKDWYVEVWPFDSIQTLKIHKKDVFAQGLKAYRFTPNKRR